MLIAPSNRGWRRATRFTYSCPSRSRDSRPQSFSVSSCYLGAFPVKAKVRSTTNHPQKEQVNETNVPLSGTRLFLSGVRLPGYGRSRFPRFTHVRRNGSSGACCEVFEGRHCSRSRQAPVFNAHRPSRGRGDSRFHHRRQGILGHQRGAQPLLRPPGPGRYPQQSESHNR